MSTNHGKMPEPVIIRDFVFPDDYPDCRSIWQNAGEGIHLSKSDELEEMKKAIDRNPDLFLVAEDSLGRVIGTVMGGYDGRRGMMYHLAITPEFQHQGIGTRLVRELEKRLRQNGCIRCYLLVVPSNSSAMHFYENNEWERLDLAIYGKDLVDD